jgi:hypothetical protein
LAGDLDGDDGINEPLNKVEFLFGQALLLRKYLFDIMGEYGVLTAIGHGGLRVENISAD